MKSAGAKAALLAIGPIARRCLLENLVPPETVTFPAELWLEEIPTLLNEGLAEPAFALAARASKTPPDEVIEMLVLARRTAAMRTLAAVSGCGTLLATFKTTGIDFVVIKGPATGRFYPSETTRTFSDIDILVRPEHFQNAMNVAMQSGWLPLATGRPQWNAFLRWCREGTNLHGRAVGNLDVHHHIPPWALSSSISVQDIISDASNHVLGTTVAPFATADHLLVVTALHVFNDHWKGKLGLQSWRDLMILMSLVGESRTEKAYERYGLGWLLQLTTGVLSEMFPDKAFVRSSLPEQVRSFSVGWRLRALGWNYDWPLVRSNPSWAFRLPISGMALYLGGSLFPSRKYVHEVDGNYRAYWARTARAAFRSSNSVP